MIGNDSGATLFISDLHLCNTRPETTGQFLKFLQTIAVDAQSLYILGDLFEYWAGDDDLNDPYHQTIVSALRALSAKGTQIFLIHGNRDLLLGQSFAETAALKLLEDPTLRCIHGKQVLLSHGDSLCTDDTAYQAFRQQVHDRVWQTNFLNQSLHERKQQIEALRTRSEQEKSGKNESIMDVNSEAVKTLFRSFDYPELLIHGHTHRPATHRLDFDGHICQRIVLGAWYHQGSYLRLDAYGCEEMVLK